MVLLAALAVQPIAWLFVDQPNRGTGYAVVRVAVTWLGTASLIVSVSPRCSAASGRRE